MDEVVQSVTELLRRSGVRLTTGQVSAVLTVALLLVGALLLYRVGRAVIAVARTTATFARAQVDREFWRDAGKLSSLVTLVLLVLAYGVFSSDQRITLGAALTELVRERLGEVVPAAILTQAVLLVGFWLVLGLAARVPARTVREPFRQFAFLAVFIAVLLFASVVPFVVAGGDADTVGLVGAVGFLALVLLLPLLLRTMRRNQESAAQGTASVRAALLQVGLALTMLVSMVAIGVAWVYTSVVRRPTLEGLVGVDLAILTVLLLFTVFRFRAHIGGADVPEALPHLIDLGLSVAAAVLAVVGVARMPLVIRGVPVEVVAAAPGLLVAAAVYGFNVRPTLRRMPRWRWCLALVLVGGLLTVPLRFALEGPMAALADLLPVGWRVP